MESKPLPVELVNEILSTAETRYAGSCSDTYSKGFCAGETFGATAWASWKVKYDELVAENERLKVVNKNLEARDESKLRAYNSLSDDYQQLKERCEKIEAAIIKVTGRISHINDHVTNDVCAILTEALKEGESNTPAPIKEIEYMPILSAELYELRAFSNVPVRVPMRLLDKDQAMSNHWQTLQRLKERGGLSIKEALSLMTLKRWMHYKDMPMVKAIAMLNDLISNNNPH